MAHGNYFSLVVGSTLWDDIRAFALHRLRWRTAMGREQYQRYHALLTETSRFYRELSDGGRAKAMHRTVSFMRAKRFVGRGMEVTDSHRLLVSFAAIKLTFGLKGYMIPHLHTICLWPAPFYSRMAGAHVKGLASESGLLHLSWKDVMEGMADSTDGLNLAVHEMAHALKVNTLRGTPDNDRFAFYLSTWMKEADLIRQNQPDDPFLRKYAQVNLHEFFAVCMENFVERPKEFLRQEPVLFFHTCYLLDQYPLEPKGRVLAEEVLRNAARRTGIRFPARPVKDYTHHDWHWSYTVLLASVFLSPWVLALLVGEAHVPFSLWHTWWGASALAALLFYRGVVTYKAMPRLFYPVFVLLGGGPMLLIAAIASDRAVTLDEWQQTHPIVKAAKDLREDIVVVTLENDELYGWKEVRTFSGEYAPYLRRDPDAQLRLTFREGLLGIIRCKDRQIIFSIDFSTDEIDR